jgi:chaperonin GroEL
VDGEALNFLLGQKASAGLQVCCVKLPSNLGHRKDLLLDIAAMCGGRPMLKDLGDNPADAKPLDLGSCRRVVISRNTTRIIGGRGTKAAVQQRITEIRGILSLNPPQIEVERLNERLAKLTGGVTILSLGAQTGVELADKKMRVDDAVNAIRCAIEEGVVPGAGTALYRAAQAQTDFADQWAVECLKATFHQILKNASEDAEHIAQEVFSNDNAWFGYDVAGEQFGDLRELGVLDPVKVVRSSLMNAASIACQMLLTEMVVTLDREK